MAREDIATTMRRTARRTISSPSIQSCPVSVGDLFTGAVAEILSISVTAGNRSPGREGTTGSPTVYDPSKFLPPLLTRVCKGRSVSGFTVLRKRYERTPERRTCKPKFRRGKRSPLAIGKLASRSSARQSGAKYGKCSPRSRIAGGSNDRTQSLVM